MSTPPRNAPDPGARPRLFYGWVIVGTAVLVSFGQTTFFNPIFSVFFTPLEEEFGWSRGELALGVTLGSVGAGLASPLLGTVIDRRGARWVIPPAAAAMVLLLFWLSFVDHLWQFYILFPLGRGLAVGAVSAAAVIAVSNWFVRQRAMAVAVASVGMRAGLACLPLIVALVIDAGSWRDGFRALALILAVVAVVPPLLFMRRRPEDLGLLPDGGSDADDLVAAGPAQLDEDWTLREAAKTAAYWWLGLALSFQVFSNGAINLHQLPHLEDQGLSSTTAASIVFVYSMFAIPGGFFGGWLAIRLRPRWTLAISMLVQAVGVLLLLRADSVVSALVYAVWYGLAFGSAITMLQVIYADYFGRLHLGLIRGSFQPVSLTFNATGPLIAGVWFDASGSYSGAFVLIAGCFVLGSMALLLARYPTRPELAPAEGVR